MPTEVAKAPTAEIGYVNASYGWGWGSAAGVPDDSAEETAAWLWPESVRTADRMRRNSTVAMALAAVTGPILAPGIFALDPQGADPTRVAELAEDLDLPALGMDLPPRRRRRGRFSFGEHVRLALLELVYGHMAFELLCDPDALAATGMARLAKLAPRFPRSIAEIKVALDGGLESITQYRIGAEEPKPIPVANLVWYAHEREGAAWQGRSLLRPAYGNWLRLDRLLRARAYLMERQSMGIPVGTAAPGASQDEITAMGDIASTSRAGDQSGVGLPNGATLTFEGVRGTLPDINAAIADERAQILDAVMAAFLRLGTSEASGNRALGETFVDQFSRSVDRVAGQVADVVTQHVVEDLWDWNYGPTDPAPAVVTRPVDAERDLDPAAMVSLVSAGLLVPDDSMRDLVRARYRLGKRAPIPVESTSSMTAEELGKRVDAAGSLIRAGFRPDGALVAVGLDPVEHTGFLPVTLQSDPAAAPPPPAPATLAARRRAMDHGPSRAAQVRAAVAKDWRDRVAELLAGQVDATAIATAVADGTDPTDAVATGLSVEDTSALAALLVELWGDAYSEGVSRGNELAPVAARRSGSSAHPVMASLSDIVSGADDVAKGILSSLADRLASALGGDDVPEDEAGLADLVDGLSADASAAERIAATETHRAMVAGAVDTWKGMGIPETRWVRTSGSELDDECADLDGTTAADWDALPPIHPNCGCELEPA